MSWLRKILDFLDLIIHGFNIDTSEISQDISEELREIQDYHVSRESPARVRGSSFSCNGSGYWIVFSNQERMGPFCRNCYEGDEAFSLLRQEQDFLPDGPHYYWFCKRCGERCEQLPGGSDTGKTLMFPQT